MMSVNGNPMIELTSIVLSMGRIWGPLSSGLQDIFKRGGWCYGW